MEHSWTLLCLMFLVPNLVSCFPQCVPLRNISDYFRTGSPCGNGQCMCFGSSATCYGHIKEHVYDSLPVLSQNVKKVHARCYDFSRFGMDSLSNTVSLYTEELHLVQCGVINMSRDSFSMFRNLSVIEISWNPNINKPQMFQAIQATSRTLTNLTLTHNRIKKFNTQYFSSFPFLRSLDMSGNEIDTLSGSMSIDSLEYLTLSDNKFYKSLQFCLNETFHTEDVCEECPDKEKELSVFPKLRELDLRKNYLGGGGGYIMNEFNCLLTLEKLNLSFNTIGKVSLSNFKNLKNLQQLALDNNWLQTVRGGRLPPRLEFIDFRVNRITTFPPKLCNTAYNESFPSLKSLDFGRNYIINLTTDWHTCLPNLEWLDFSKNDVRRIKNNTFANYGNLKYLFLSNLIPWTKVIEPAAFNSSSLQNLSLRFNWMNFSSTLSLRQIFQFCPNMKWLDISYNYIENVDLLNKILLPLQQLEHLFLEKMYLYSFPFLLLKSHTQLKTLVLDKNMIYTIPFPDDFNNMTMELNLQELSVAHCVLHTVNQSTFPSKIRSTVKYLNLGDNQFRCDCAMLWFRNAVNTTSGRVKDSDIQLLGWKDNYKCRSPTGLGDHQFWTFEPEEICDFPNPVMIGLITAGASLFVFSILTGVAFWNRWYIKYWWFKIARIRRAKEWKGTEREHLLRQNEQYDAYVVYNTEDNMFVHHAFRELVENELGYKLHIWERDADSGAKVDVVLDAMYAAKHVIVAVSNNILKDQWAKFQVDVALDKSIKENCEVLFVKLDNLDLARISKTWCVLMTRTPAVDWPDDAGSIKYKLVKEILRIRFGKPLHKDACINEPKYDHIPDQEI